jgi:hypothetical protein
MFPRSSYEALATQTIQVSRSDRWCIHQRLQELMIPSWCPDDGSLQVAISTPINAILVRSAVKQCIASRNELVDWLNRCWSFGGEL